MKYLFHVFALLSVGYLIACGPSDRSIEKASLEQLMALHDSTMNQTGYIIPYQDSLRKFMDSTNMPADIKKLADSLHTQLSLSDKLMYDWMHNYKSDFAVGKNHEEVMKYLEAEITKVKFIKKRTEESLTETKQFLKSKKNVK